MAMGSEKYPAGRKFSLFLVAQGEVLVGLDNHKPKGPHLHLGKDERRFHDADDGGPTPHGQHHQRILDIGLSLALGARASRVRLTRHAGP